MSIEDNENYYILEEEETDKSPLNFAAYNDEERKEDEKENLKGKKTSPFALLLQIMFNPVQGWKTLRRSKINIEALQSGCFYPLLALLALSNFADLFYSVNTSLSQIITQAVVSFVAFFFGFFCVQMILNWTLPKDLAIYLEEKFGKEFLMIALSTLALFAIIRNIVPMLWPILIFLPIWTLYLMYKGIRFFKMPSNEEMKFFVLSGASVIAVPLIIEWSLNAILPY